MQGGTAVTHPLLRPVPLSLPPPNQLAAYLDSLIDQGYDIYVVRGSLPAQQWRDSEAGEQEGEAGRWFTPEEVTGLHRGVVGLERKSVEGRVVRGSVEGCVAWGSAQARVDGWAMTECARLSSSLLQERGTLVVVPSCGCRVSLVRPSFLGFVW